MKIYYHKLILNQGIQYLYNPFSGIADNDIIHTIYPNHPIDLWIDLLEDKKSKIIEFVGQKGRGKTTHLKLLQQYFSDSEIYHLDKKLIKIKKGKSSIIFIDSIQRLSFFKRMKLWLNRKTTYAITTHHTKAWEYRMANRQFHSFKFQGISVPSLRHIIANRISLATNLLPHQIKINDTILFTLIQHHGDDYRSILNLLYDSYKNKGHEQL